MGEQSLSSSHLAWRLNLRCRGIMCLHHNWLVIVQQPIIYFSVS